MLPPGYIIRPLLPREPLEPARLADINSLYDLFPEKHPRILRSGIEDTIAMGGVVFVIIHRSGSFVGMLTLGCMRLMDGKIYSIRSLAVAAPHQGQGLAEHLLNAAVMAARQAGAKSIEARVRDRRVRNRFITFGFTRPQNEEVRIDLNTVDPDKVDLTRTYLPEPVAGKLPHLELSRPPLKSRHCSSPLLGGGIAV